MKPRNRLPSLTASRDLGARIEALINDDLVQNFFGGLRDKAIAELLSCRPTDHEGRLALAMIVRTIDGMQSMLVHAASNGLRAEEKLVDLLAKRQS